MRNIIFILSSLLTLSSCSVYQEVWVVEKYPIEWEEDVIIKSDHQHYKAEDGEWECLYFDNDTVCWHHYDTIVVKRLEKRERVRCSR